MSKLKMLKTMGEFNIEMAFKNYHGLVSKVKESLDRAKKMEEEEEYTLSFKKYLKNVVRVMNFILYKKNLTKEQYDKLMDLSKQCLLKAEKLYENGNSRVEDFNRVGMEGESSDDDVGVSEQEKERMTVQMKHLQSLKKIAKIEVFTFKPSGSALEFRGSAPRSKVRPFFVITKANGELILKSELVKRSVRPKWTQKKLVVDFSKLEKLTCSVFDGTLQEEGVRNIDVDEFSESYVGGFQFCIDMVLGDDMQISGKNKFVLVRSVQGKRDRRTGSFIIGNATIGTLEDNRSKSEGIEVSKPPRLIISREFKGMFSKVCSPSANIRSAPQTMKMQRPPKDQMNASSKMSKRMTFMGKFDRSLLQKSFGSEYTFQKNFININKNMDDKITLREWQKEVSNVGLGQFGDLLYLRLSLNSGNDFISKVKFFEVVNILSDKGTFDEKVNFGFSLLDPSGLGYVNRESFEQTYSSLLTSIEQLKMRNQFNNDFGIGVDEKNRNNKNEKEKAKFIEKFFDSLKKKSPNRITVLEFKRIMKTQYNYLVSAGGCFPYSPSKTSLKNKLGEFVSFGSPKFEFVLNIMRGITMTIDNYLNTKILNVNDKVEICNRDFHCCLNFKMVNERRKAAEYQFVAFAPKVFINLRKFFGVDELEYRSSFGIDTLLSSLIAGYSNMLFSSRSAGKSGSFFYYSFCGRYICKTITSGESEVLLNLLNPYLQYISKEKETLLTKLYGLYKINNVYFIVMENVFMTENELDIVYDLKGSRKGRKKKKGDMDILKDLDFINNRECIKIGKEKAIALKEQVLKDSGFLKDNNIIDYSFLCGIYYVKKSYEEEVNTKFGIPSTDKKQVYYYGIIDHLINFGLKKRAENIGKSLIYGKKAEISVVHPKNYSERFVKFLHENIK